jgi:hypothetical protein
MVRTPLSPALRLASTAGYLSPSEVSPPIPVTTTRRFKKGLPEMIDPLPWNPTLTMGYQRFMLSWMEIGKDYLIPRVADL